MTTALRVVITAACIVAGFLAFWYFAPRSSSFGMFESVGGSASTRLVLSYLATIVGVILGTFYRALRELQGTGAKKIGDLRSFTGDIAHSIDLWLGLAGSPLVYVLLLNSTDGMSLPGLLVVALQNGFCCLLIVNGFVGKVEREQVPH